MVPGDRPGLDPLWPGTRIVFEGDRIKGIYPSALDSASAAEFQSRAGAFFAWATSNAPEVARLAPGGRFRYDAVSAGAWLEVMRRYAAARRIR